MSTADGRIDGGALRDVLPAGTGEYEVTGELLDGDAWVCGRTTMQEGFADGTFVSKTNKPAGPQPPFVARRAESYAIAVDTRGSLLWPGGDLDGDHLICVLSEQATDDYLAMLRERQISYIVAGRGAVDLARAVEQLGELFGIRTLLLEGGGKINGSFLAADLIDELSILVGPIADGGIGTPTLFDAKKGRGPVRHLKLMSVEKRKGDIVWLRYKVKR